LLTRAKQQPQENSRGGWEKLSGDGGSSWESRPEDVAALLELIRRGNYGTLKLILTGRRRKYSQHKTQTQTQAQTHTHTLAYASLNSGKVLQKCLARSAASA